MFHPNAEINLQNVRQNYKYIKSKVRHAKIMAVVKANAYGHGVAEIAHLLVKEGVYGFCVALSNEVRELIRLNTRYSIVK